MKIPLKKSLSIIIALVIMFSFASCSANVKTKDFNNFSIMDDAEIIGKLEGVIPLEGGADIEIHFPEEKTFDTVILENDNHQVDRFSISVKDKNGEYQTVYEQDSIGDFRYCEIGEHTSDSLKICIESSNENQFDIAGIDVLNVNDNKNDDFRVTSYIVCPTYYANGITEKEKLQSITDVILFGIVRFDENGEIYLQDCEINGETISGDKILKSIITDVKSANPDIKVHCNALGPDGADADSKEKLHSQAFITYGDKLATNIMSLLDAYDFDGFYFDYEYPYKAKSRRDFSKFIVRLDEMMGEYILGASLSHWNCSLSKSAIKALDRVEIMAYDESTWNQHSGFGTKGGALSILQFKRKGYDLSKCDLGLPFYGRTHGGDETWPSYAQLVEKLENNPFENYIQEVYGTIENIDAVTISFNGVQMIKDKTAFANDYGLGGVMVWHYSCDVSYESDMSLFKAIQTSLATRN